MAKSGSSDGKPKSNLGLILGIVAGVVLLCCCAPGIGGPAIWYFLEQKPTTIAMDGNKDKDKEKDKDKDKDKEKEADKFKPGDGRAKMLYGRVVTGMSSKEVEAIAGGRGDRLLMSKLPHLEDKKFDAKLAQNLRDRQVNVLFEWRDLNTDDRFVVGYTDTKDLSIVTFKAHYYGPDGKAQVIHELIPAGKK